VTDDPILLAIGTVAHNSQFTVSELSQFCGMCTRSAVRRFVAAGLLNKVRRGLYFPTTKGWEAIEGE